MPGYGQHWSFRRIGGERFLRLEVHGALDGKPQRSAYARDFGQAHVAEFRKPHAEVAKTEGDIQAFEKGEMGPK